MYYTMTDLRPPCDETTQESIEALHQRFQSLQKKHIETKVRLDDAQNRLDSLKERAREEYNTDEVAELQAMLAERRAENERLRVAYQNHLDTIDAKLAQIERDYAETLDNDPTEDG